MTAPFAQQVRTCAAADGARIAYATTGAGPPLVKVANWLSHLEFDTRSPVWRHWIRELSRDHTLVRYDERGVGLSEREVTEFSLDAWVRDLEAVVDALGLERFPLLGLSQGGPIAIAYAARHPERVSHLILYGSYARGRNHRQLSAREREERELMLRIIAVGWGNDHPAFRQVFTSLFIPDASAEQAEWFNELQRVSAAPESAARMVGTFDGLDAQALATRLRVPALVLHATGDLRIPFAEGELLASLLPGARFVPLESRNHILLEDEPAWPRFLAEVRAFLGVAPDAPAPAPPAVPAGSGGAARRARLGELFDGALDLPAAERAAFLARACGDDVTLRREVEALLELAERPGLTARLARAAGGGTVSLAPVRPGDTLLQYRIEERLGTGGMGVVYRAADTRLQRAVALKFLPAYLSDDDQLRRRFLLEAKAGARLDHPNICTVLEVEQLGDGQLVIVMPCYEGETLKAKVARGPLPVEEALTYAAQVASGLAHAHAAGLIHRDIKPANLIVTSGEWVKILDFGIAKLADHDLTHPGAVLGTPSYMSPEQAAGEPLDHRTDLWALGAVLYEMLTGHPPFRGDGPGALFHAIQQQDPAPVQALRPEVPPALSALVHRLLEKDPAQRFAEAGEVAERLRLIRHELGAGR